MKKMLGFFILLLLIISPQVVNAKNDVPDIRGKTLTEGSQIVRTSDPEYLFLYMFLDMTIKIDDDGKVTGWSDETYSNVTWFTDGTSTGTIKLNLEGEFDYETKRFNGTFTSTQTDTTDTVITDEDPNYLSWHLISTTTYNGTFTGAQSETGGAVVLDLNGTYTVDGVNEKSTGESIPFGHSTPNWVRSVSFSDFTFSNSEEKAALIRGTASLSRDSGSTWLDLEKDGIVTVKTYDRIRTGPNSRLIVKYPDGSYIKMKSNTTLTILPNGVQLEVGDSWFNLQKHGKQFKVVTPTTIVGCLGTEFNVSVAENGDTTTMLTEGSISAEVNNQPVLIIPGDKFVFTEKEFKSETFEYESVRQMENSEADEDISKLDFGIFEVEEEALTKPTESNSSNTFFIVVIAVFVLGVGGFVLFRVFVNKNK